CGAGSTDVAGRECDRTSRTDARLLGMNSVRRLREIRVGQSGMRCASDGPGNRQISMSRYPGRTSRCTAALRKRERDCAHGEKQKQIKSASDQVSFNGGINLFFHVGLSLL